MLRAMSSSHGLELFLLRCVLVLSCRDEDSGRVGAGLVAGVDVCASDSGRGRRGQPRRAAAERRRAEGRIPTSRRSRTEAGMDPPLASELLDSLDVLDPLDESSTAYIQTPTRAI